MTTIIATLISASLAYVGAFSRFTDGKYTPAFYKFQLDRAPNEDSNRFVPYVDTVVGTLILIPATRLVGLCFGALFFGIGVAMRLRASKNPVLDIAMFATALVALWGNFSKT